MRRGITLLVAMVPLTACTLLSGIGDLTTGSFDDAGPFGSLDSTPANEAAALDGTKPEGVDSGPDGDAGSDAHDAADVEASTIENPTGCSEELLLGNNALATATVDGIASGTWDTYGYAATKAGSARCLWFYAENTVQGDVSVEIYSTATDATRPDLLLAGVTFAAGTLKKGWNSFLMGSPIAIDMTTELWIGVTASVGGFQVREHGGGATCGDFYLRAATSAKIPDPFPASAPGSPGNCDLLAYLSPAK